MYKKIFIVFIFLGIGVAHAQEKKRKKEKPPEIILNGKRFLKYNNWVNVGIGVGEKFDFSELSFPVGVNYNFHIRREYFQLGYLRSDIKGLLGKFNPHFFHDLHFCYGRRIETTDYNAALFAGIAFLTGLQDSSTSFSGVGAYAELQLTRKVVYDVGYGLSLFINYNRYYPLIGIRLDLYLSNAYIKKQQEN